MKRQQAKTMWGKAVVVVEERKNGATYKNFKFWKVNMSHGGLG